MMRKKLKGAGLIPCRTRRWGFDPLRKVAGISPTKLPPAVQHVPRPLDLCAAQRPEPVIVSSLRLEIASGRCG
jgi:hypothetical protein